MKERTLKLNNIVRSEGNCVVYVMSRDQRVDDNFALNFANDLSEQSNLPLIVYFNLLPKVGNRLYEQYRFMFEGLKNVSLDLDSLNITFLMGQGDYIRNLSHLENSFNPEYFVFDFSPLRGPINVKKEFAKSSKKQCFVVDTHNVIPVWLTSEKEEYGAYTIRPKIYREIENWLNLPKQLERKEKKYIFNNSKFHLNPSIDELDSILESLNLEKPSNYYPPFKGGSKEARRYLKEFIENKLELYGEKRNDPTEDFQSNLSPYLHYGQIYSLRAVIEVLKEMEVANGAPIKFDLFKNKSGVAESSKRGVINGGYAFIEEIVIRKELTENFVYYNKNYDSLNGVKDWARNTLLKHKDDKREYIYEISDFENAKTHDPIWNKAQVDLTTKGKIHGYMRMYWAKKILEWTKTPDEAVKIAIYLNDKYHLDGYDPNGFAGILWSIGGLHDRPWFEREVFGQIRYMNANGLKNKFDVEKYIS